MGRTITRASPGGRGRLIQQSSASCGATGQPITGWLSPGGTELAAWTGTYVSLRSGVTYVLDWAHDELPSPLRTASGLIHAMPQAPDMDDTICIWQNRHSTDEFADAQLTAFVAASTAKDFAKTRLNPNLAITASIDGLKQGPRTCRHPGVWPATASEVLAAFTAQQEQTA
jgi:hypothetical protein